MKSVLVSIDFSEGSLNSCKYALEIVPKNNPVSLWLFHVYADQLIFQPTYDLDGVLMDPIVDIELFEEMKKLAYERMDALKKEVEDYIAQRGFKNVTVKEFLIPGDPEWMISDVCEELTPDVIVMSTKGSGRKEPLEGNMAKKIIGKAKVPVLAVPEDYTKHQLSKIMFVTHLENEMEDVDYIKMIFENLRYLNPEMIVTYFKEKEDRKGDLNELEEVFNEEFNEGRFKVVKVDFGIKVKEVAQQYEADLLAFVAHKENPLKRLFKKVITKKDFFEAGIPVLGLPPERKE